MRTIILAGGYAARLYPITASRAKPLLPVAGKPIINYLLDSYPLPNRPIVSTNSRFAEQFAAWKEQFGYDVELVVEETRAEEEKLGTVGAISYLIQTLGVVEGQPHTEATDLASRRVVEHQYSYLKLTKFRTDFSGLGKREIHDAKDTRPQMRRLARRMVPCTLT